MNQPAPLLLSGLDGDVEEFVLLGLGANGRPPSPCTGGTWTYDEVGVLYDSLGLTYDCGSAPIVVVRNVCLVGWDSTNVQLTGFDSTVADLIGWDSTQKRLQGGNVDACN